MKCQSLFSRKIRKNIINLWSAELAQRVVMVRGIDRNAKMKPANKISEI